MRTFSIMLNEERWQQITVNKREGDRKENSSLRSFSPRSFSPLLNAAIIRCFEFGCWLPLSQQSCLLKKAESLNHMVPPAIRDIPKQHGQRNVHVQPLSYHAWALPMYVTVHICMQPLIKAGTSVVRFPHSPATSGDEE